MKIADMINLFTAYNKEEDFRIAVVATDHIEAIEIAREYGNDAQLKGDWELFDPKPDDKYDCDYIVTYAGR